MIWVFFVRFSVPVLGVFYGTSLIADEVEDKTITYLFTRPIPRGAVLRGQVPGVPGLHDLRRAAVGRARLAARRADGRQPGASFWIWSRTSACWRWAWRSTARSSPSSARRSSGRCSSAWSSSSAGSRWPWRCRAISSGCRWRTTSRAWCRTRCPANSPLSLIQEIFREVPTLTESLIWLAVITWCLPLAGRANVTRREYVLEQ